MTDGRKMLCITAQLQACPEMRVCYSPSATGIEEGEKKKERMSDGSPGTDGTAGDRPGFEEHTAPPPSGLLLLTLAPLLCAFLPNLGLAAAEAFIMKNKDKSRIKEGKEGANRLPSRGGCVGWGGGRVTPQG